MRIPPKTVVRTRDALAIALGVNTRTVAHYLALGCPGTPRFYVVEDVQNWLARRAELAQQKRRRRRSPR